MPLEYLPRRLFGISGSLVLPDLRKKILRDRRECFDSLLEVFQPQVMAGRSEPTGEAGASCGTLGKVGNCQLRIFLDYDSSTTRRGRRGAWRGSGWRATTPTRWCRPCATPWTTFAGGYPVGATCSTCLRPPWISHGDTSEDQRTVNAPPHPGSTIIMPGRRTDSALFPHVFASVERRSSEFSSPCEIQTWMQSPCLAGRGRAWCCRYSYGYLSRRGSSMMAARSRLRPSPPESASADGAGPLPPPVAPGCRARAAGAPP